MSERGKYWFEFGNRSIAIYRKGHCDSGLIFSGTDMDMPRITQWVGNDLDDGDKLLIKAIVQAVHKREGFL